jgi:hypothetical protein
MITFRNNSNKKLFIVIDGNKAELDPNGIFTADVRESSDVLVTFGEASTTVKKLGSTKFRLMLDTKLIISKAEEDAEISLKNKSAAFFAETTTYEWAEVECITKNVEFEKQYSLGNEKEILEIYRPAFRKARMFDIFEPSGLVGIGLGILALLEAIIINVWAGLLTLLVSYAISCAVNAFFAPTIDNRTKKKLKDNGYPDDMILFAKNIEHLINNPPQDNEFWWDYWKRTKGI